MKRHRPTTRASFENDPNVLLAARKELIEEMKNLTTREIYRGFRSIWIDAKTVAERMKKRARRGERPPSALRLFQKNLDLVKDWNTQVITQEFNTLIQRRGITEEEFSNLLKSLTLVQARILSSINMNRNAQPTLKIPAPRNFLHKIYGTAATTFIENPYLFEDRTEREDPITIQRNMLISMDVIRKATEDTIRSLTPFSDMLKEYLQATSDDEDEDAERDRDSDDEGHVERSVAEQMERLEKVSQMASGKESIRKSERLGQLINEELDALEQERQSERARSVGVSEHGTTPLAKHLETLSNRNSTRRRSRDDEIPAESGEISEKLFNELLDDDPNEIGGADRRSHIQVAAHRTITDSDAEEMSNHSGEKEVVREVRINRDELHRQPAEAIVTTTTVKPPSTEPKRRNDEFLSDDEDD